MLPPETIATRRLPATRASAATATAPAPSATTRSCSASDAMAAPTSASLTTTISSRNADAICSGNSPGAATRRPSAKVGGGAATCRRALPQERAAKRIDARDLGTDDPDPVASQDAPHAGDEAAPADWNHDDVRAERQELRGDRRLTGDDLDVVERVQEAAVRCGGQGAGLRDATFGAVARVHDACAERATAGDLGPGRAVGDDDGGREARRRAAHATPNP